MVRKHLGDPELKFILHNIPNHVFGKHSNCTDQCPFKSGERDQCVPWNKAAWWLIQDTFENYFTDEVIGKIRLGRSTQLCESLHGVVAQFAPKDRHFSSTQDYVTCVHLGILKHNEKTESLLQVCIIPSGFTGRRYRSSQDWVFQPKMVIRDWYINWPHSSTATSSSVPVQPISRYNELGETSNGQEVSQVSWTTAVVWNWMMSMAMKVSEWYITCCTQPSNIV